jgi:hypothetical protein
MTTHEDLLLSVSQAADLLAAHKDQSKAFEYALYTTVEQAYRAGVPAFIIAEVLGCGRKNIYDMRRRYDHMTLQKNAALSAYKAELDTEQKFDELLKSVREQKANESDPAT